jgi:hypothetical protein
MAKQLLFVGMAGGLAVAVGLAMVFFSNYNSAAQRR